MQTIRLINERFEQRDLVCGEFKTLSNTINHNITRSSKKLATRNYNFSSHIDKIDDRSLNFKAKIKDDELANFQRFILEQDMEFLIEWNTNSETKDNRVFTYAKLSTHSRTRIETTNLNNFEIKFDLLSYYVKENLSVYEVGVDPEEQLKYNFDYNQVYSNETPLFAKGFKTLINNGDTRCSCRLVFEEQYTNPKVSIDADFDDTTNAFGVEVSGTTKLINNGFSRSLSITQAGLNVEQLLDFNKLNYLHIPKGVFRFNFVNVTKCTIYILEEYYDLPF